MNKQEEGKGSMKVEKAREVDRCRVGEEKENQWEEGGEGGGWKEWNVRKEGGGVVCDTELLI